MPLTIPRLLMSSYVPPPPGELLVEWCGTASRNVGTNTTTIPGNVQGQVGDVQLLCMTWATNSSPSFPTIGTDGWRWIFNPAYCNDNNKLRLEGIRMRIMWRELSGPASSYVIGAPSGFVNVNYSAMIFRGVKTDDFFHTAAFTGEPLDTTAVYARIPSPHHRLRATSSEDISVFTCGQYSQLNASASNVPTVADPVTAACRTFAANTGGLSVVASKTSRSANNLFRYSETLDPAAWSFQNTTRSLNGSTDSLAPQAWKVQVACNGGGPTRYRFYTTADLIAGKGYIVHLPWRTNGTHPIRTTLAITYLKPSDNSEHGILLDNGGTTLWQIGTEVSANDNYISVRALGDGFGNSMMDHRMFFIAPETGTFTFNFSFSGDSVISANPANLDVQSRSTSVHARFNCVGLYQVDSFFQAAQYIPTTSSPVLPETTDYVNPYIPRVVSGATNNFMGSCGIIIRAHTSKKRPTVELYSGSQRNQFQLDSLGITGTQRPVGPVWNGTTEQYNARFYTQQIIHSFISGKTKFYFELDVVNLGGSTPYFAVGIMTGELLQYFDPNNTNSTIPFADVGHYGVTQPGVTYLNGTSEGSTTAAWTTNDKIGIGIDFDNQQITTYLNGSLTRTLAIQDATNQMSMPWRPVVSVGHASSWNLLNQFQMNFRGPFSGRKPVGFFAFDFDNELT